MQSNQLELIEHRFQQPAIHQRLLVHGSREDIIDWLVWNDGNGVYTNVHSAAEDYAPLTLATARAAMKRVLEEK